MTHKYNRFGKRGTYPCGICGKLTRDTGRGEAGINDGYCAACLYQCYVDNAKADYGVDSDEYREAVLNLEKLKRGGKHE